jgi:hypothetical protein
MQPNGGQAQPGHVLAEPRLNLLGVTGLPPRNAQHRPDAAVGWLISPDGPSYPVCTKF